jgi:hypothetical protein
MPSIQPKISQLKISSRLALILATMLLLIKPLELTAQAQPAPEVMVDRMFVYESSGGRYQAVISSLKKWLGSYQRIRKDDDNYLLVFDGGSLPIDIQVSESGSIAGLNFGCPISKTLSISDAPSELRQVLSQCSRFKPKVIDEQPLRPSKITPR